MAYDVSVFVFSYNRGRHLLSCVNSIRSCAPQFRVTVIDDHSDDEATLTILSSLDKGVAVVKPNRDGNDVRLGSLYGNMALAMELGRESDLIIFIQDDMQFVRSVSDEDVAEMIRLGSNPDKPGFIYPGFLKQGDYLSLDLIASDDGSHYTSGNSAVQIGRFYSDILAVIPAELERAGWEFVNGEAENSRRASLILSEMRYLKNPFLMYAPLPKTYRKRKRNLVMRAFESIYGFGEYEIEPMSADLLARWKDRDAGALPVAEHFLSIRGRKNMPAPWRFSIFEMNPMMYRLYNFTENPLKYSRYAMAKAFRAWSSGRRD